MANFDYDASITAGLRQADFEALLEKVSAEIAAEIAARVPLNDAGADGDYEVADDTEYVALMDKAARFMKKVK